MNLSPVFGKLLIVVGVALIVTGLLVIFRPSVPWLGRLPGDIYIERGNTRFYFPVVTCLLVSVVVSLLLRLFHK